jgi:hypothetical protein
LFQEAAQPHLYNLESIARSACSGHAPCKSPFKTCATDQKGLIMANPHLKLSHSKPLFGTGTTTPAQRARPKTLAAELNERLREKYQGYERAALRLELRGEYEAAALLRKEAGKARLLRNAPKETPAA